MNKEIKIGTKITKEEYRKDSFFYIKCKMWCNIHNAHIEEKETYFEIVENKPYVPSIQEQVFKLEYEIETLNKSITRDMIVICYRRITDKQKEEANKFYK